MRTDRRICAVLIAAALAAVLWRARVQLHAEGAVFTLESPEFKAGGLMPSSLSCWGEDRSPALVWSGLPDGTKSLALALEDPDAPAGTWVHWVLWNIPPSPASLPGGLPRREHPGNGVCQGLAGGVEQFKQLGYFGPCPPSGVHRYFFQLYALDRVLDLAPRSSLPQLRQAMQGHVLGEAELMGRFGRAD